MYLSYDVISGLLPPAPQPSTRGNVHPVLRAGADGVIGKLPFAYNSGPATQAACSMLWPGSCIDLNELIDLGGRAPLATIYGASTRHAALRGSPGDLASHASSS
jgi:hypothetical protein